MHIIDLATWPRRKHFEVYHAFDYPHFSLSANVDITRLYAAAKQKDFSISIAITYLLARAANEMPEFRWRIRGKEVVEHEVVHPSTTVLAGDDLFSFCTIPFVADFSAFARQAGEIMENVKKNPTLEDEPGQDDLLFMTSIPWVSFTSIMLPIHMHPADSVPRLSWGKFIKDGDRTRMPLAVQVSHALMDGVHVGRYYERVQAMLDEPETLKGGHPF